MIAGPELDPPGASGAGRTPAVVPHATPGAFLERAGPWLERAPAEHNLVLSIASDARARGQTAGADDVFFASVERDGEVVGAAFRTPPHKLCVTDMPPDAALPLVEAVADRYARVPAVLGPEDVAVRVAREWTRLRGGRWRAGMRQRVYACRSVERPAVPGEMRTAGRIHLPLIAEWGEGFAADAGAAFRSTTEQQRAWVEKGRLHLWVHDGAPVSMALGHGFAARGARVGYVYSPPSARRRGYASALVATLTGRLLDDDAIDFCMLYTDLANPTSNSIYQRIGYRPVADVVDVELVAAGDP